MHRGLFDRIKGFFRSEDKTKALEQLLTWMPTYDPLQASHGAEERSSVVYDCIPHVKFSQYQNFHALKYLATPESRHLFKEEHSSGTIRVCRFYIDDELVCQESLPLMLDKLEVGDSQPFFLNFKEKMIDYYEKNQSEINSRRLQCNQKSIQIGHSAGADELNHISVDYLQYAAEVQPLIIQLDALGISSEEIGEAIYQQQFPLVNEQRETFVDDIS